MTNFNTITDLALNVLRGPMNPNPITARDKLIAELQIIYRTFYVEFDINEGVVRLPKMFSQDFGHDVRRFARLTDPLGNQFKVLVEKINGHVYITWGWKALKDFYNIYLGAWIILRYTGMRQFGIVLKDRFEILIDPPTFVPPMKFKLDLSRLTPEFLDDLPEDTDMLSYSHDGASFGIEYEKMLLVDDDGNVTNTTSNVVYQEIFRNL